MLEKLKLFLDPDKQWTEGEEAQLATILEFAGQKIINQRWPFGDDAHEVPVRYQGIQVRMAAEIYGKMGGEGQTTHSENGISRAWEDADVAQGLLREITPMAEVV